MNYANTRPQTHGSQFGNWILLTVLLVLAGIFLKQNGLFTEQSGNDPNAQPRAVAPRGNFQSLKMTISRFTRTHLPVSFKLLT